MKFLHKDISSIQIDKESTFMSSVLLVWFLQYLAWSLKRSKAVNNCKSVVGVIGKGHVNGVVYGLVSDTGSLRFRDLAGKNSDDGSWIDGLVKSLVRDTIIGIILWALYEFINGRT